MGGDGRWQATPGFETDDIMRVLGAGASPVTADAAWKYGLSEYPVPLVIATFDGIVPNQGRGMVPLVMTMESAAALAAQIRISADKLNVGELFQKIYEEHLTTDVDHVQTTVKKVREDGDDGTPQ